MHVYCVFMVMVMVMVVIVIVIVIVVAFVVGTTPRPKQRKLSSVFVLLILSFLSRLVFARAEVEREPGAVSSAESEA